MKTRAILVLFLALAWRTGAAPPTAAELQAQLNKAKTAQATAEAKLQQLKKESDANEAKRKSLTEKLSSLQKQLDNQNAAVINAWEAINSSHPKDVVSQASQLAEDKSKALDEIIKQIAPGAMDKLYSPADVDKLSGQDFRSDKIQQLREALDKKTAADGGVVKSQEAIKLSEQLNKAEEEARATVREQFSKMDAATKALETLDPDRGIQKSFADMEAAKTKVSSIESELNLTQTELNHVPGSWRLEAAKKELLRAQENVAAIDDQLTKAQKQEVTATSNASNTAGPKKPAPKTTSKTQTTTSPSSTDAETATTTVSSSSDSSNTVTVPDLSAFTKVSEMKAVLAHAGLVGAFSAAGPAPSKDLEFKLAGQSPPANTKVPSGSTVTISIYQAMIDATATTTSANDVTVPDLSVFDNVSEMKAVLAHAGLVGSFGAAGPAPSKDKEFKFASQSPAADTKVKAGTTVTVSIYQPVDTATETSDTVPSVVNLTLEQATSKLSAAGLSVGGIDNSAKTDKQDKVNTIFEQSPAAGAKIPDNKIVRVRIYGSLVSKGPPPPSNPLDQLIPGPEKDLPGNYSGTATYTKYDLGDYKREHGTPTTEPLTMSIMRDATARWSVSSRMGSYSSVCCGGGHLDVNGGSITYEEHSNEWDIIVRIVVQGNQLTGSRASTQKVAGKAGPTNTITFTATRQ